MTLLNKIRFTAFAAILFAACGNPARTTTSVHRDTAIPLADTGQAVVFKPVAVSVDKKLGRHIQDLYKSYLRIQVDLAEDQQGAASGDARQLLLSLDNFKDSIIAEAALLAYNNHIPAIRKSAAEIIGNDIDKQRAAFGSLSDNVFELLKFFDCEQTVYQAHCPMAFNDKGASWLSDKPVIRNPYYGDDMLECGEIVAMIKK